MDANLFQTIAPREPTAPTAAYVGFDAWLASRKAVLSKPMRDKSGILLPPGTPVLLPDSSHPGEVLRDTPENEAELHELYEQNMASALQAAVQEIADEAFARQTWILSADDICKSLAERGFDSVRQTVVRDILLGLQNDDPRTYALCINQFGEEEFRHASVVGGRSRVTV